MSHTPGPWHRNIKPASKYPTIFAGRNTHVAYVAAGQHGSKLPDAEIEANLVLIQHAPALLAAARAALDYIGGDGTDDSPEARAVRGTLGAAIAAATGEG